ncbi:MAG: single-stranded DNA-binding protein [Micromonosporaceae bacterium]|nr:single-stranded DNA-binding protein [Micromonosporaceae bacterium]
MFDMRVSIVGTVLTKPERRVVEKTNTPVTTFRVVMNYRRYDRASETWTDYGMFRVRVVCWRRLADHVHASLKVGDPVIVVGRLFTRDWQGTEGELRVSYELEADTVGHDLSRGVTEFTKVRAEGPHSVIEDAESDRRVAGEVTHPVDAHGLPIADDPYEGSEVAAESAEDALEILRRAGMTDTEVAPGEPVGGQDLGGQDVGGQGEGGQGEDDDELIGVGAGGRRRRGR